jgi:steroid delta-isomerase-like uncharacterized protein
MTILMTTAQNKETVRRLYDEVLNRQDADAIDALVDANVVIHDPMMGEMYGIEAFRQFIATFQLAFPQQHTTVEAYIAENDLVTALHTHTGVNTGSFMGMPPTGRAVSVRGLELFRIREGKIVELWRHDDDAGLLRQLGLIPEPAGGKV